MKRFVALLPLFQILGVVRVQCAEVEFYVMCHGQEMDDVDKEWIKHNFDGKVYIRQDYNFQSLLPERDGSPNSFFKDSPLTKTGILNAESTGDALYNKERIEFNWILASPALRAVETATAFIEGWGKQQKINIEPDLFENMNLHRDEQGKREFFKWMTDEELKAAGYPVYVRNEEEISYRRKATRYEVMQLDETDDGYYIRQNAVLSHIEEQIQMLAGDDKNKQTVLLSVHGTFLDALPRLYVDESLRRDDNLDDVTCRRETPPYLRVVKMVRSNSQSWKIENVRFDDVQREREFEFDVPAGVGSSEVPLLWS